jgi:peptide deformylase
MGMIDIVKFPDPILLKPVKSFDFTNTELSASDLAYFLMQAMNDHKGIGLSANQIGVPLSAFVLKGHPENIVCFNPKIVHSSSNLIEIEEACHSVPGVILKIKRPDEIRVRFQVPSGETLTKTFNGLTARTFQHEYDHLNGIVFINKVGRYHRDKAMKGYYK